MYWYPNVPWSPSDNSSYPLPPRNTMCTHFHASRRAGAWLTPACVYGTYIAVFPDGAYIPAQSSTYLGLCKFLDVSAALVQRQSLMNDILALRKRFLTSSLPRDWAKCSSEPKKYENSSHDGGGIDSPPRAPVPELSTSSPWFNSSSEGSSTTYAVSTLVINTSCESCSRAVANSSCSSNPVQA